MANEIITEMILNLDKFREQLKEAEAAGGSSGKKMGENFSEGGGKALSGLAALAAATGPVGAAIAAIAVGLAAVGAATAVAMHKMIEESSNAEKSIAQLASAMSVAGGFSQGASARFEEYAHSLQNLTGISDDLITKNAALLVSIGHVSEQGLKGATKAALDLQAGLGGRIGVEDAFNLVAKAAEGNTAALGRYGIKIDETKSKSENFRLVLAQIEKQFGGMAAAQANTFAGSLAKLSVSFNDVFETAGRYITQSPVIIGLIKMTANAFESFSNFLKTKFGDNDVLGTLIKQLFDFGTTAAKYVLPPIEVLKNSIVSLFNALATGGQTIIVGLIYPFQRLVDLGAMFSDSLKPMKEQLDAFAAGQQDKLGQLATMTVDSVTNLLATPMSDAFNQTLAQTDIFVQSMDSKLKAFASNTSKAATNVSDSVKKASFDIQNMVGQGIASSVNIMTNAILKGQNMMKAFASTILSVFGDAAIQLGTFFIINGIAIEALKSISGLGAVAAGIALVALGTVMKSLGNAGASGANAGLGAGAGADFGGGAAGGGVNAGPGSPSGEESQQEQKKANIQVVIQGNVLDRRETGLAIADVIQETFASNGLAFSTS